MDPIKVIKNEEYLAAALGILDLARVKVDICTYKFELSERIDARPLNSLVHRLYDLASNKILVRVLLNTTGRRSGLARINENASRTLKKHGLEVRTLRDGRCQHAKMLLVDGCLGIIGSHNWSRRSMTDNFEVSVMIQAPQYLVQIQEHFEKIWEGSRKL